MLSAESCNKIKNIPCLVLVGKQDESFYPEQFEVAFKPADKFVRAKILDDAKHLSLVDKQKTFEIIKEWVKETEHEN